MTMNILLAVKSLSNRDLYKAIQKRKAATIPDGYFDSALEMLLEEQASRPMCIKIDDHCYGLSEAYGGIY